MRIAALLLVFLMAGCLTPYDLGVRTSSLLDDCRKQAPQEHVLYFAPGNRLVPALPSSGSSPGNAFSSAFATDDLKPWLSDPVPSGLWLVGNVTLSYWARSTGTPAPVVTSTSGQGYRFFNQFGSDRSLQPSYATEYGSPYMPEGTITHYEQRLAMPAGGFVIEKGDRARVLLTDLAFDGPDGAGHDILFGGGTPSQVRFTARCYPDFTWTGGPVKDVAVLIPANQGAITHRVPTREGVNRVRIDVSNAFLEVTDRLTISLKQTSDANPGKDDVDITLLDGSGEPVWSIGSPYADERGTLWKDNIQELHGHLTVEIDSYSATAYQGRLVVTTERAGFPRDA